MTGLSTIRSWYVATFSFYDEVLIVPSQIFGIAEGLRVLHSMKPPVIHGNMRGVGLLLIITLAYRITHIFYKEKVLIGNAGQPLITDFALAKARHNLLGPHLFLNHTLIA